MLCLGRHFCSTSVLCPGYLETSLHPAHASTPRTKEVFVSQSALHIRCCNMKCLLLHVREKNSLPDPANKPPEVAAICFLFRTAIPETWYLRCFLMCLLATVQEALEEDCACGLLPLSAGFSCSGESCMTACRCPADKFLD